MDVVAYVRKETVMLEMRVVILDLMMFPAMLHMMILTTVILMKLKNTPAAVGVI